MPQCGLADDLSSAVPLESALGLSKLSSRGSKLFTRPDLIRNFEQLSGDGAALYLRTLSSRVVFENNTSGRYAIFSSDAEQGWIDAY